MTGIIAFIQARMSSSRLPGKVLEPIAGRPAIIFMVERARQAATLDLVVVVTSVDPSDDLLADALVAGGVAVFRGELDDVLCRYAAAAQAHDAEVVVRLTGDCPLVDPAIVDRVVRLLLETGCDYASNTDPPSYPDGLDVECFTRDALIRADKEAKRPAEREHVTLWMRSQDAGLDRRCVAGLIDSSHLRLTVDYPDDLAAVRTLVDLLGGAPEGFDHYDMLRCIESYPELREMNRHERNDQLAKAAAEETGQAGPAATA